MVGVKLIQLKVKNEDLLKDNRGLRVMKIVM